MSKFKLKQGDNLELLKKLPDNSIDSIVTDPPYGLSFMNKKWDYDVPSVELWKEVYRVLKPGGHVLSFGGTRTYHRMVVNIEDAGFEIRDQIMWLYGSGFPKSHNIGKAVDATIKTGKSNPKSINESEMTKTDGQVVEVLQPNNGILGDKKMVTKTIGASLETEQAQNWQGWGTALKPANEPICVARKPLSEKSVAENVLKWGTGGINVDGCRVGTTDTYNYKNGPQGNSFSVGKEPDGKRNEPVEMNSEGRFPANIILECICDELIKGEKGEIKKSGFRIGGKSENSVGLNGIKNAPDNYGDSGDIHTNPMCPCRLLDEQSGVSKSRTKYPEPSLDNLHMNHYETTKIKHEAGREQTKEFISDKGGASRFFYQAKVSKKERNMGLDGFDDKKPDYIPRYSKDSDGNMLRADGSIVKEVINKNVHPTVKPVNLMVYLCRLVTPVGGTILDPYMGSGSTGIAALLEGFNFIGMDLDPEYVKIAEARINSYEDYREFLKK